MILLQDPNDPTIGFLLDGMDHLCCLVRKYIAGSLFVDVTNYLIKAIKCSLLFI